MKFTLLSIPLVLMLGLTSCTKDESKFKLAEPKSMIATVDGGNWNSSLWPKATVGNETLFITAVGSNGTRISILLIGNGMGTYVVNGNGGVTLPKNHVAIIPQDVVNQLYVSSFLDEEAVGEVKITEFDVANQTVSGTFFSRAKQASQTGPVVDIKNGSFTKIGWVYSYSRGNPGSFSSRASANIAGVPFDPFYSAGEREDGFLYLEFTSLGRAIHLSMPEAITQGQYTLGGFYDTHKAFFSQIGLSMNLQDNVEGELVILEHSLADKKIKGTFKFDQGFNNGGTRPLYSITNGKFEVSYQ